MMQALASCPSLLQQLDLATRSLPGLEPPQDSFAMALLTCLQRLQPVALENPTSESPADVLHALRQCIGNDILPAGQEHDAVEAYEVMLGLVGDELQKAFISTAKLQLEAQGSLAALLQPAVGAGVESLAAAFQLGKAEHEADSPRVTSSDSHALGMLHETRRSSSGGEHEDGQLASTGDGSSGLSLHPALEEPERLCARPAKENGLATASSDQLDQDEVCKQEAGRFPSTQQLGQQRCQTNTRETASSGEGGSTSQLAD